MTGTWTLVRLALRRDRILLPVWIVGLAYMVSFSVTATRSLYPGEAERVAAAGAINATASLVALYGRIYDPTSLGEISLIKMTAFGAALIAILFVFVVVRHTRAEEEAGRLELLNAGVVGRAAPLAAGIITAMLGSALLGLGCGISLLVVGLPASGCFTFALSWALSGIVFSAVAAVAAQVTTSRRAAIGLGVAAIGVAYVLRAVGDLAEHGPSILSWLSPIGWSQQLRPFAGNRVWVTLLPLAATAVLVPLAFWLRARRDLGAGLLPDRPGPAEGGIRSAFGLAWRLQRGLFVAWLAGSFVLAAVLGSAAKNVTGLLDSPGIAKYIALLGGEKGLITAFLAAEVAIMSAVLASYGIATVTRLRWEETAGHAEALLSTPTSRLRFALSHYLTALLGVAALLLTTGLGIGLAHGLSTHDVGHQVGRLLVATAAQVPAAWVIASLVLLLFGWVPRAVTAAWGLLAVFVVFGEFGALWKLPQWVLDLSPLAHSPKLPGNAFHPMSLVWLVVVAAVIGAVGLYGWRRRDLTG